METENKQAEYRTREWKERKETFVRVKIGPEMYCTNSIAVQMRRHGISRLSGHQSIGACFVDRQSWRVYLCTVVSATLHILYCAVRGVVEADTGKMSRHRDTGHCTSTSKPHCPILNARSKTQCPR